ncbi:hypothetical protein KEM52_002242, partial [Ascosphaera acerosa]
PRDLKFALLKRVSQLSGHLFPDSQLSRLTTLRRVLAHLHAASRPAPKKLAERLLGASGGRKNREERQGVASLASLPNVRVSPRKVSISQRETEVGRWKIIEAELRRRGLPVNADAAR